MNTVDDTWESEIAALLNELAAVQTALLSALAEKRQILASRDTAALAEMATREQSLAERLSACHDRRQALLELAGSQGKPADSVRSLSDSLPEEVRKRLRPDLDSAAEKSRLLQHQCLTNWVVVQRSLLHLSQLVEIIATGGRFKPTYGNSANCAASGALVDRAA